VKSFYNKHGFVVIKNFLSDEEIEMLITEYKTKIDTVSQNKNVSLTAYNKHLESILDNPIDTPFHKGIFVDNTMADLPWHQDTESFFLFQTHDIIKAYIPIIKERSDISGISLISNEYVDTLNDKNIIRGRGATVIRENQNGVFVIDDDTDERIKIDLDLRNHISPLLVPGDLLIFNGDVIHKTQDTITHRVAVSFMCARGKDVISLEKLNSGGKRKRDCINNNPLPYERVQDRFKELNATTLTIRDVF
jgi:ectoine hydroxylase-related dioxygenase (phytanoyl-CoA dioxygenase family)